MQSALGDAAKQDGTQGVVAIAKKAQDLYRQQQEIQKKADQWCALGFPCYVNLPGARLSVSINA